MPEEGVPSKGHDAMLRMEEIERFVRVAAGMGFKRIRLTGGEPLVQHGIVDLIDSITKINGIESVALTTNGILLPKMASELKAAGLSRVNISLDTLDADQYRYITRWGNIEDVFAGIDAALKWGFSPVKVNSVVVRSLHQDVLAFARLSVDRPLHVRFIEYMPIGDESEDGGLNWTRDDTIPNDELLDMVNERAIAAGMGKLIKINKGDDKHGDAQGTRGETGDDGREARSEADNGGRDEADTGGQGTNNGTDAPEGWGPASYYHFEGAKGTVGFISALSRHFCAECNRLRVTADGKIRPCLFSDDEYDVKGALRAGDDDGVREAIRTALGAKPDEHHDRVGTARQMSQIGG
jgi:cyclic pyranopterin phosphate synthase